MWCMWIVMQRFKQLMFHSFACPGRMSWLVSLHVRRDRQARSAKSEAKKGTTETWSQTITYMSVTDFWLGQLPSGSCCAHSVNSFFPEGQGAHLRNNAIAVLQFSPPGCGYFFLKSLKAGTLALACGQGYPRVCACCLFAPRDVHTLQNVLGCGCRARRYCIDFFVFVFVTNTFVPALILLCVSFPLM